MSVRRADSARHTGFTRAIEGAHAVTKKACIGESVYRTRTHAETVGVRKLERFMRNGPASIPLPTFPGGYVSIMVVSSAQTDSL